MSGTEIRLKRESNRFNSLSFSLTNLAGMKGHHALYESTTLVNYTPLTPTSPTTLFTDGNYFNKSLPSTSGNGGGGGRLKDQLSLRPPFITTVTKGKFLPSKFDLLVERNIFTFSSRPRPVGANTSKQSYSSPGIRSGKELGNENRPRGAHDYFNLMWDPHVARGSTIKVKAEYLTNNPAKATTNEDPPKRSKKSIYNQKKLKTSSPSVSNGNIYTKHYHQQKETEKRLHEMIQTERHFLEELTSDSSSTDALIQTDKIYNLNLPLRPTPPMKSGVDASTQVLPGELFDFELEVEPILDTMVAKILEQGLTEVVEEEELCAIREQRNRFEDERRQEEKALQVVQAEKERITKEKEKLQKMLELELTPPQGNGSRNSIYSSSAYFLELLPSVLNSMKQEGLLDEFLPSEKFEEPGDLQMPQKSRNQENLERI